VDSALRLQAAGFADFGGRIEFVSGEQMQ
jgi:hypothetical protein